MDEEDNWDQTMEANRIGGGGGGDQLMELQCTCEKMVEAATAVTLGKAAESSEAYAQIIFICQSRKQWLT